MEYRDDDLEPVFKNSPSTNIPMSTEETFTIEETGPEYLSDNSDLFTLVKTWSEREAWTDLTVKRQTKLYDKFLKLSLQGVIKIETGNLTPSLPEDFIMINVSCGLVTSKLFFSLSPFLTPSLFF